MQVEVEAGCGAPQGGCWAKSQHSKRLVYAILLAQLLSVVLAVTGVSSASLAAQGVYAPTVQAFFSYCLLAIVYGSVQLVLPFVKQLLALRQATIKYSGLRTASSSGGDIYNACCSRQCSTAGDSSCEDLCSHALSSTDGSSSHWQRMRKMWPAFAALALIDVEANVLVVKAYQYTSLTSVTLLDCFTIPAVMLLSWLVLHSRYRPGHFLGAALCVSGLAVLVLGDARAAAPAGAAGNNSAAAWGGFNNSLSATSSTYQQQQQLGDSMWLTPEAMQPDASVLANDPDPLQRAVLADAGGSSSAAAGSAPLLGDALVLLGALLYSVCNVTQELILSDVRPSELLAGIGVFGALLAGLQAVLLGEWHSLLAAVHQSWLATAGPMLGFACAMLCFYSLVPHVLMLGGATVLNISLLSSDAWAALARFLWFGGFAGASAYFFLGSLVMVACGIVVYALSGSPKDPGAGSNVLGDAPAAAAVSPVDGSDAAAAASLQGTGRGTGSRQPSVGGYSRLEGDGDVEDQQAAPSKQ
ncbi:hypothetical protein OEZ85_008354 [Tetradesmus obliquus]|uniref:EamA domain-containing protein n=1 Tax=Tetradesmus obliquus TaxID=3088 RepID=A0ABY8TIY4_TETOB|nr:hypothetical protein OEZ85_008354 [Tetradesmus obliquus]